MVSISKIKSIGLISIVFFCANALFAQKTTDKIRVNQVGFYPASEKIAIVTDSIAKEFFVKNAKTNETVFTGALKAKGIWEYSEEFSNEADFTKFNKVGTYYISVPNVGDSYPFEISNQVNLTVGKASLGFLYYQRASTALPAQYAGK
jgi:endoglucanase